MSQRSRIPGDQVSQAPSKAASKASWMTKGSARSNTQKSHLMRAGLSQVGSVKSKQMAGAAAQPVMQQISGPPSVASTIRTTTTTRERLADIELQLEREMAKRRDAERAIMELTKGQKY